MSVAPTAPLRVLTLNAGSSSLKFAVFDSGNSLQRRVSGSISGIGKPAAELKVRADSDNEHTSATEAHDHAAAFRQIWTRLHEHGHASDLGAIGHRVVHGGPSFSEPTLVTSTMLAELRRVSLFAPVHLPPEIALIETASEQATTLPHVACFDTTFHRDLPRVARLLPVPRRLRERGVRRYGFHGLSYAYLTEELARIEPRAEARRRVIFAHLGNGASLAAVRDGRCIDTSMGFTPAAGIPMSTRTGDIDPGALVFAAHDEGLSPDRLEHLVNRESGLLAISETTGDLRELLRDSATDERAADAVALFCYHVRKWIGAFAAALGGLDTLVFAGGVGEHASAIRACACEGLAFLGLSLDSAANEAHRPMISAAGSRVTVRVMKTDEEQMIARAVCRLVRSLPTP